MSQNSFTSTEYSRWISELKGKIQSVQLKAAISVNRELLSLYWEIGKSISEKIVESNWGSGVVSTLARDLAKEFPDQKGYSRSNLFAMKKWYEFYSSAEISTVNVQQLVGQIPWGHNVLIISKSTSAEEALFYCMKTIENNWSRPVLSHQINSELYIRQGKAINNFNKTLPVAHSDLAGDTLKDPCKLDFLLLQEKATEKDIESQWVNHITSFLLELGVGFSFVERQFPVKIDGQDYYIDLLFYHIKLKCYVVIELKTTEFKAEFAGKLNMHISAVDDLLKWDSDNQTIGLLLCQSKSQVVAEYTLRGTTQPMGLQNMNSAKPYQPIWSLTFRQ